MRFLIAVLLISWVAPGVRAQVEPDQAASDDAADSSVEANALIEQGVALRESGEDAQALQRFESAHQTHPSPRALTQIALAEAALGRWLSADTHLEEALQSSGDEWLEARRAILTSEAQRIGRRIGSLEINGEPDGAEVIVDGVLVGTLPLAAPVRLTTGVVRLEVRAEGYYPLRRNVDIQSGALARESVRLSVEPPEPERDPTPNPDPQPDPTPQPAAPESGSGLRTGGLVALGGSVVFGALALTMYLVRESAADTFNSVACLDPVTPRLENCRDERDRVRKAEKASAAMLALTGVAAVAGIVMLLLGRSDQDTNTGMRCGPGPGDVGVSCGARF